MRVADVGAKMAGLFCLMFRPRPKGSIADWASGKSDKDKAGRARPNIFLSSKESGDFAGPYDPDLNPLPTILFDVYQSGEYRKAVFKKSSQSGVTLVVLILICWFVSFIVRNFLYVINKVEDMREVSQERLQPMLKRCRAAADQIPESEDDMKTLRLSLRGCVGYLASAGTKLLQKSVALAIFDEVDEHPDPPEGEERAVDTGAERGKKQSLFFEVWLSKPRFWDGPINQEYLIGTRHKCYVPCPHCGTMQELRWTQVQFDHCQDSESGDWDFDRVLSETYYLCKDEECQAGEEKGRIYEHHKPKMIRNREWRRTNFGKDEFKPQPGVFSCEITDLYSTFPTATWGVLAKEYIESEDNPKKRQTFWRGRLAQPEKRKKVETSKDDIWNMTGDYDRGQCPVRPDVVLMFCDVQGIQGPDGVVETGVKKWVKAGFTFYDEACYVIDYGEIWSYSDLLVEADAEVEVLNWDKSVPVEERVNPTVYKGIIDEGFQQKEVRTWATSTIIGRLPNGMPDYRFFTAWGQGGMHSRHMRDVVTPRADEKPNVTHNGLPFYAYRFSDDNFKHDLYNRRIGLKRQHLEAEMNGDELPSEVPNPLYFPQDIDSDFVSELTQEKFEQNPKTQKWEWKDPRKANDYGDGVKGCLVGWYIVRPAIAIRKKAERDAANSAAS